MANGHDEARAAVYGEITRIAGNVTKISSTVVQAQVARDLALAFRYLTGGPQPGSATVEK